MDKPIRDLIDEQVIALYDDFTHRHLDRRLFMERLSKLVGVTAAAALLPLLRSNYALAQQVPADDARLVTATVSYPGSTGTMKAYVARPKGGAKLPAVIVIHENRGLTPHIQDVARRAGLAGFVALAPDLMSAVGGTPAEEDKAMAAFGQMQVPVALADLLKTMAYLHSRADVTGKIGVVGFCWGGGMVNQLAVSAPDLTAASAFYGIAPPLDKVANIKAALILNYAGLDDRVNATRAGYEEALKKANIAYTAYTYEGVNHAFHNDTGAARYNADAAKLAWQRTIDLFNAKLKS